jgi:hypothetical protein
MKARRRVWQWLLKYVTTPRYLDAGSMDFRRVVVAKLHRFSWANLPFRAGADKRSLRKRALSGDDHQMRQLGFCT